MRNANSNKTGNDGDQQDPQRTLTLVGALYWTLAFVLLNVAILTVTQSDRLDWYAIVPTALTFLSMALALAPDTHEIQYPLSFIREMAWIVFFVLVHSIPGVLTCVMFIFYLLGKLSSR